MSAHRPTITRKRTPPVGASPGTLAISPASPTPVITLMDFGPDGFVERVIEDPSEIPPYLDSETVTWVDVEGMGDEGLIRRVGDIFGLHPLALADAVNIPQRPKSDMYDSFELVITRLARINPSDADVETDQLSIFFGLHFVLTIHEQCGSALEPVRMRLRSGAGPIQRSGPDYLVYSLLDTAVDGFFPVLEELGEYLENVEQKIFDDPRPEHLREVYHGRRQLLELRRAIWPQREAVNSLVRDDNPFVSPNVRTYMRDVYDHTVQIIDMTETYRDLASNLMDMYMSALGQRTNDVMKILTVMSSIFIPLTFITGLYGMNFIHMPGLKSPLGFGLTIVIMLTIAGTELSYFRRKGWLGRPPR
ncbi:MAG: magnesium/cobalt transporter CorA [Longimicrobiales bacterium]